MRYLGTEHKVQLIGMSLVFSDAVFDHNPKYAQNHKNIYLKCLLR